MEQKDLKLSGYRQLEQLRQEYESLPVPLEARDRILAGIAQGKKETDKAQMKGVIFMKLMKRTGMTAVAAMVAITLLTNLRDLDVGLKVVCLIFVGTKGYNLCDRADNRDLFHGIGDGRMQIGKKSNGNHSGYCGHACTFH